MVQNVLLKQWKVVRHIVAVASSQGVVAVGEDDGEKLLFVVEEVAAMDVGEGDLMLLPLPEREKE